VSSLPPEPPPQPPPPPQHPPQPYFTPYPKPSGYPTYPTRPDHTGPPPSKTLAGWSLGLAFIPSIVTWIISIVFACIVFSRSKDGRDHGKGMATAAFVIVGIWVLVAVVVIIALVATGAERDESGRVTDGGRASVLDLRVGDCLPDPGDTRELRTVDLIECSEPHRAEVYALFDLEGEYTTQDEVVNLAEAGCIDRFKAYVGVAAGRSALSIYYVLPLDETTFREDPGVSCIALAAEDLTSSLKGSKR
jgi:hypothetical protein